MNTGLKTKLLVLFLGLLLAIPIISVGCEEGVAPSPAPSPGELSTTRVPNLPLDVYIYGKQSRPTTIPAKMLGVSQDINVESLAIWGIPAENDFAFGAAFTLTTSADAAAVFDRINVEKDVWKKLSGSTIYLVMGSGLAAKSLQTAISNNDFKNYDDAESLQAAASLPGGDTTKLAAIVLAKPGDELMALVTKNMDTGGSNFITTVLKLSGLKVVAAGLYSPQQIDVARIAEVIDKGGSIGELDLGLLVSVKSGLPGFVVEPVVKKLLTEQKFVETKVGELTLYQGSGEIRSGEEVPILVRLEGNRIFAAVSGQESYARTLITSVQVK